MKKSKMNFAQKFIIIALVLILIVSGIVIYGVYDYYNVEVVNNRQEGQIYDVKDVSEEQMLSMFAKRFNPYLPKINEDTQFTSISNPQKDVTATSGFESYTIINVYDNFYTNYGQIGLTKEDVRGYDNREYHNYEEYYTNDFPLGLGEDNYIIGILLGHRLNEDYLFSTGLGSVQAGIQSFVSYSAYSKRMDRYEVGDLLFDKKNAVVTELSTVVVNGTKVEIDICEYLSNDKNKLEEERIYLLNEVKYYNKLIKDYVKDNYGVNLSDAIEEARNGCDDYLLTLVRGRFRVDGIYYEIVYPLINRWYNTESNNIGAQSTDYQKLSAVATKSMTYLVADFIK